jgi:hypothetical protein
MLELSPQTDECFSLLVALNNRNLEIMKFLWEDRKFLWDSYHLTYIIDEFANQKFLDGMKYLLKSPTTHDIYLSLRP